MLQKFEFNGKVFRTILDEKGDIWIPCIDIFDILGYSKNQNMTDILDDDEKKLTTLTAYSGDKKQTWLLNESGFYHVVLSSTKPEAKEFRKKVTGEILPALRKAGYYTTEQGQQRELDLQQVTKIISEKKSLLKLKQSEIKDLKTEIEQLELQRDDVIVNFAQLKLQLTEGGSDE
jgi:prophage antirepressor-like protein